MKPPSPKHPPGEGRPGCQQRHAHDLDRLQGLGNKKTESDEDSVAIESEDTAPQHNPCVMPLYLSCILIDGAKARDLKMRTRWYWREDVTLRTPPPVCCVARIVSKLRRNQ